MAKFPPQHWILAFRPNVLKQLRTLTKDQRQNVLAVLRRLLEADNPYSIPHIKKLEGDLAPLRRARAGDFRIFFQLKSEIIQRGSFEYKGKLEIVAVYPRKDAY